jgi:hypothetical protein
MDIYSLITQIANWVGWPIITGALLLSGGYAFWVLNQRIEALKEKNDWLEARVKDAEAYSPSALVERLAERHKILSDQLEILQAEYKSEKQKNESLEAEKNDMIIELENQRNEIDQELDRVAVQLRLPRKITTFFDSWYSQKGTLSIFCSDLGWLAGTSSSKIVKTLKQKGSHLNLYLKDTQHEFVQKLLESGASVYQIKPEFRSAVRFSLLDSNGSCSIIIRNKAVETDKNEIELEEYKNHPTLVQLAKDLLINSYNIKL